MKASRFGHWLGALGAYRKLTALAVLAAAAALIAASEAKANTTQTTVTVVPINVSPFDECTGEFVDLTGSLRVIFNSTTDAAGGQHRIEVGIYGQLTGTGELTGNSYRFVTASPSVIPQLSSDALIFSDAGAQLLLAEGSQDNLVHTLAVHFTVTPTGQVTSVSQFTFECRG